MQCVVLRPTANDVCRRRDANGSELERRVSAAAEVRRSPRSGWKSGSSISNWASGCTAVSKLVRRSGVWAVLGCVWLSLQPASALAADEAEGPPSAAALLAPPGADEQASKLDKAKQQIEQLNYLEAQQLLFEVVQSGQATPEQMAQAYFNLGIVEAALDHDVEATDSFYLALMLQPSLLFPSGGSPKIRERLNAARSRVTEVGVLEVRANVLGGELHVHVDNDPLKLIKRIEVVKTNVDDKMSTTKLSKDDLSTDMDGSVRAAQVVLYDEAGNQLKIIDVDLSGKTDAQPSAAVMSPPSVWKSWGLWAGVAGGLALGSTYFIMESSSISGEIDDAQNDPEPDPIEIARLEDDRDRVALYGLVGYSLAGAAAVTAGVLLITGDDGEAKSDESTGAEASFIPSFSPRHVGADFRLRF